MRFPKVFLLTVSCLSALGQVTSAPSPQEPAFELPVQLVGFPVIIAAVRITNFIKKLAYSLNPQTYTNRVTRSLGETTKNEDVFDANEVEKKLIAELGENVCVYERICAKYAGLTLRRKGRPASLDWNVIFSQYKASPSRMKDNYLVSVFLGDIVGSPELCHQLAKRGRSCGESSSLSD
ncbi:uncharacterized protein [Venturia canescens]|uniref:uncharacterized protein n=1 Tax=Venturia canescens TaxID=32260 RepID=UPI001C9C9FF7|nr:uncharacterized protein LOC122414772 [Venturia canescens]XP_043282286.1 uncharacterized protein LOC122414772 [Venturia canescens]XP_043282287.1 uncharacterized protein LOC122414772 [Venturia canescens]